MRAVCGVKKFDDATNQSPERFSVGAMAASSSKTLMNRVIVMNRSLMESFYAAHMREIGLRALNG